MSYILAWQALVNKLGHNKKKSLVETFHIIKDSDQITIILINNTTMIV